MGISNRKHFTEWFVCNNAWVDFFFSLKVSLEMCRHLFASILLFSFNKIIFGKLSPASCRLKEWGTAIEGRGGEGLLRWGVAIDSYVGTISWVPLICLSHPIMTCVLWVPLSSVLLHEVSQLFMCHQYWGNVLNSLQFGYYCLRTWFTHLGEFQKAILKCCNQVTYCKSVSVNVWARLVGACLAFGHLAVLRSGSSGSHNKEKLSCMKYCIYPIEILSSPFLKTSMHVYITTSHYYGGKGSNDFFFFIN